MRKLFDNLLRGASPHCEVVCVGTLMYSCIVTRGSIVIYFSIVVYVGVIGVCLLAHVCVSKVLLCLSMHFNVPSFHQT